MTRVVRLSVRARGDISRLIGFLVERDARAAGAARQAIAAALASLADLPDHGRPISPTLPTHRELRVKFGRYGYAIRYRVKPDEVFVARVFHTRERR